MIDVFRIDPNVPSIPPHVLFVFVTTKGFSHVKCVLGLVHCCGIVAVIVNHASIDGIPAVSHYVNRVARLVSNLRGCSTYPIPS